jgi:integrase
MPTQDAIEQSMRTCARMGFGGGLYLIRGKADGRHYWRVDYTFAGKRQTLSLGVFPLVAPEKARQQADAHIALAKTGTDPSASRQANKNQPVSIRSGSPLHKFEILHPESFQVQAQKWMGYAGLNWHENTLEPTASRLETYLFPELGHKLMQEVGPKDVSKIIQSIVLEGKPDTAQRVWEIGNRVSEHSLAFEVTKSNPFVIAKSLLPKHKSKPYAAVTHPTKLANLLSKIYGYRGTFLVQSALKLLTMLHVRPGNLRKAKWDEFDLKNGWWCIPGEYMKDSRHEKPTNQPHVVPLPQQAVEILWQLRELTGRGESVFPNRRGKDRCMSQNTMNKALKIMGFSTTKEITAHGFRAVARTLARQELGFDEDLLELQLDHTVRDPEGKPYAREVMIRDRKKMIQAWADYLDGLRQKKIVYDDPLANFTPVTSISQKPTVDTNVIDFGKYHEVENPQSRTRSANQNTWSDWDDLDPRGWENVNEFLRISA